MFWVCRNCSVCGVVMHSMCENFIKTAFLNGHGHFELHPLPNKIYHGTMFQGALCIFNCLLDKKKDGNVSVNRIRDIPWWFGPVYHVYYPSFWFTVSYLQFWSIWIFQKSVSTLPSIDASRNLSIETFFSRKKKNKRKKNLKIRLSKNFFITFTVNIDQNISCVARLVQSKFVVEVCVLVSQYCNFHLIFVFVALVGPYCAKFSKKKKT